MRYLVISPCEDARHGVLFSSGDEFLPEPDADQAERLVKAGCLRVIPDSAPALPGSDDSVQVIGDLRHQLERAEATITGLNDRLSVAAGQLQEAGTLVTSVNTERDKFASRVSELEKQLEDATKPPAEPTPDQANKTTKAKG